MHRDNISRHFKDNENIGGFLISLLEFSCNPKIVPLYSFDSNEIDDILKGQLVYFLDVFLNTILRKFFRQIRSELLKAHLIL